MLCTAGFRHQFIVQTRFRIDSDSQPSSVEIQKTKVHEGNDIVGSSQIDSLIGWFLCLIIILSPDLAKNKNNIGISN